MKLNQESWGVGILTLLAVGLWLIALGDVPLRDWDEGYYGTVARDMFETHNWLYPTYLGEPFFLKPPLLFWLLQISYSGGGVSEWTSRWPPALITALGVPLIYGVARHLFRSPSRAFWAAGVYLTLLPVVRLGRLAMLDGIINTFLLFALLCLLKGLQWPRWLLGVGLGLGAIALCKGVLTLVFGVLILIWLVWAGQLSPLGRWQLWLGLTMATGLVASWYWLQWQRYGPAFWAVHFQSQSFERLTTAVEGNQGPPWFYLLEIIKYTAPWLVFAVPALAMLWRERQQFWGQFIIVMGGGCLLLISVMGTKLPWYVMPVYPFYALMIAPYLTQLWEQKKPYPPLIGYLLGLIALVVMGAGVYLVFSGQNASLLPLATILGVSVALTTLLFFQQQRAFLITLLVGMYLSLGALMMTPHWNWEVNEAFAVGPVGQLLKSQTPPGSLIYTSFAYSRPSLDFYGDRQVMAVDESQLLEKAQSGHYLLIDPTVQSRLAWPRAQILGRAGDFILIRTAPTP
jgi:4-amino-4-deoxy-L-arabinose transferase-like glycosyltransferase